MMVRLVSCHIRECRQAVIDRERETKRPSQTKKGGRKEGRKGRNNIEQNTYLL
jgi:hypothetical protein